MITQNDAIPQAADQTASQEQLLSNLRALATRNSSLVERLCWPVNNSHILTDTASGKTLYQWHAQHLEINISDEQLQTTSGSIPDHQDVFLFACGLGEQLADVVKKFPDRHVTVWERDPWLLRLALSRYDFNAAIQDERITFLLGIDLLDAVKKIRKSHVISHPILQAVYAPEWWFVQEENAVSPPFAAVAAGELFVDDIIDSLPGFGYSPWLLDFRRLSLEELEYSIEKLKPAFVFSTNYQNGLAEFCHKHNLPLLCWEVDPHLDDLRVKGEAARVLSYFSYNKANLARLSRSSFNTTRYLPLATNPERRFPEQAKTEAAFPVAFVGSSMVQQVAEARQNFLSLYERTASAEEQRLWPAHSLLQAICEEQAQDYTRFLIPDSLQKRVPDFNHNNQQQGTVNAVMLIGEIMAAEKRITYLNSLSDIGVHVWGDPGWTANITEGVHWHGYAGHRNELNSIYSSAAINIDISRLYQMEIIPMRVFDILACKGFLITEYSDELASHFLIGVELETYKTIGELREKVRYYLANPERRQDIASQGYRAVRERHTIRQRLQVIFDAARIQQHARSS